jgi:nitrate/nitrite transporter NarK
MKKIIISIAIAILTINVFYLMFAFILWELDVSKWQDSVRFCLAMVSFIGGGFSVGIYLSEEYDKEQKEINKNK